VDDLHVPPHAYAQEAGWELLPTGGRRDLFFPTVLPLVPPEAVPEVVAGVNIGTPTDQHCPWCGRQLISLLDIDLHGVANSVLRLSGTRLRATTCDVCSSYGVVFSKNSGTGESIWHPANARPDYLPDDTSDWDTFPEQPLVLSGEWRHFMESANWMRLDDAAFSQIGGLPTWIQDAEYPVCPDCSQTMVFFGQISNEGFNDWMEGIDYCFLCPQCNVVEALSSIRLRISWELIVPTWQRLDYGRSPFLSTIACAAYRRGCVGSPPPPTRTSVLQMRTLLPDQKGGNAYQHTVEHDSLPERGLKADLPCLVSKDPLCGEGSRPAAHESDEEQLYLGDATATAPGKLFVEPVDHESPQARADDEEQIADGNRCDCEQASEIRQGRSRKGGGTARHREQRSIHT
jgi:hypothetical protein